MNYGKSVVFLFLTIINTYAHGKNDAIFSLNNIDFPLDSNINRNLLYSELGGASTAFFEYGPAGNTIASINYERRFFKKGIVAIRGGLAWSFFDGWNSGIFSINFLHGNKHLFEAGADMLMVDLLHQGGLALAPSLHVGYRFQSPSMPGLILRLNVALEYPIPENEKKPRIFPGLSLGIGF